MTETTQIAKKQKKKNTIIETVGKIEKIFRETEDTQTLRMKMPFLEEFEKPFKFRPGQFVMVRPEIAGKVIPRAYSISSSPTRSISDDGYFDLTVRQTKNPTVSKWLNDRKVGDEILFRGPYGNFYWDEKDPKAREVFLLGAGSGITPLKSILEYIHDNKYQNKVKLLYSCRYENEIILRKELEELTKKTLHAELFLTLTREEEKSSWKGHRGRIDNKLIEQEIKNGNFDTKITKFYICGSPRFVGAMMNTLLEIDIPKDHILREKWD